EKRNHPGSKLRQGFWMVFRFGVNNWGKKELTLLSEKVALNLHQQEKAGKIVILKIRYEDFSTLTKRKSLAQKTQDASQISQIALQLYEELSKKERGVRLLGITMTGF
ncbi:hypothetical protein L3A11_10820, partial [Streptococcus pneumoniae]|nr:hypothetical protein [Streptococcus pneumoniae]